jgi:hypothetical protein
MGILPMCLTGVWVPKRERMRLGTLSPVEAGPRWPCNCKPSHGRDAHATAVHSGMTNFIPAAILLPSLMVFWLAATILCQLLAEP